MQAGKLLEQLINTAYKSAGRKARQVFAADIDLSESQVSRIISGKRNITPEVLKMIDENSKFTLAQKTMLRDKVLLDVVSPYLNDSTWKGDFHPVVLNRKIAKVTEDRLAGNSSGSRVLLPILIEDLLTLKQKYKKPSDHKRFDRLIAYSASEVVETITEIASKSTVIGATQQYAALLRSTLYAIEDDTSAFDSARMKLVIIDYVAGDFDRSIRDMLLLLEGDRNIPPLTTSFAIAHGRRNVWGAYVKQAVDRYEQVTSKQFELLKPSLEGALEAASNPNLSSGDRATVQEGIAYGYGLIGDQRFEEHAQKAKQLHHESTIDHSDRIYTFAGIKRSTFFGALNNHGSPETIISTARDAIQLLDEAGYQRRKTLIIDKLTASDIDLVRDFGLYARQTS